MGTRNLTLVQLNNEYKIAQYGQWDGYPSYTGIRILNFLKTVDLNSFKKKVEKCRFVANEELDKMWLAHGIDRSKRTLIPANIFNKFYSEYPALSRDTGCDILNVVNEAETELLLVSDENFAQDSLFCEWAYVIDLDNNKFEIYEGFNKVPLLPTERFYVEGFKSDNGYHPVKKKAEYDLFNLPDNKEIESL